MVAEAKEVKRGSGLSISAREKERCIVKERGEKSSTFRACVNGKTRCVSILTMNFLGSSNEIHST